MTDNERAAMRERAKRHIDQHGFGLAAMMAFAERELAHLAPSLPATPPKGFARAEIAVGVAADGTILSAMQCWCETGSAAHERDALADASEEIGGKTWHVVHVTADVPLPAIAEVAGAVEEAKP